MPLTGPGTMLRNTDPVLIVALSGRALARSAHAAMIPVTVLDVFCDADTRVWADSAGRIGDVSAGIDHPRLLELADDLCPPSRCGGLVYGAGFESTPGVLSVLSEGRELFGNKPEVLADICAPKRFFAALERLGVPFPTVRFQQLPDTDGWLAKRAGASGGAHVQPAQRVVGQDGYYYQREAQGRLMSVLFLANGREADIVGVSEQWSTGAEDAPYTYGGAVSHQRVSESLYRDFRLLVAYLALHWELRGLNSVDLMVDGDDFKVLEVNARPTATAELYDYGSGDSLFKQHLAACRGAALNYQHGSERMRAHRLVYAERDLHVPCDLTWPTWCSDLPVTGADIRRGEPVCTVHASANSLFSLTGFLQRRIRYIQEVFMPACVSANETECLRVGVNS